MTPGSGATLAGLVQWLLRHWREYPTSSELVTALAEALLGAGLPVWRLRVTLQTLHPQVTGWILTWNRDARTTEVFRAPHEIRQSPAYRGSPIEHIHLTGEAVRADLRCLARDAHPVLHELAAEGGTDYLALPLKFSDGHINSITLTTDRPDGFTPGEVGTLEAFVDYLVPIFEVRSTHQIAESLLNTYVGPRTGHKILNGLVRRGDGETIEAAIWFGDLRDFTGLSEALTPAGLLGLLNVYFEQVAAAVTPRGGEILRFIGDAMLIVFPVAEGGAPAACRAAVDAVREAYARLGEVNETRRAGGEPEIRFGVGLDLGQVLYGNVGAPERLDFTVIGRVVNRAARAEDLTKALGVSPVMSAPFAASLERPVVPLGEHEMRGFATPQALFGLG